MKETTTMTLKTWSKTTTCTTDVAREAEMLKKEMRKKINDAEKQMCKEVDDEALKKKKRIRTNLNMVYNSIMTVNLILTRVTRRWHERRQTK